MLISLQQKKILRKIKIQKKIEKIQIFIEINSNHDQLSKNYLINDDFIYKIDKQEKMDLKNEKCVMVIDANLPLGIIANTAAIMGITLGKKMPEVVGCDVVDQTGNNHLGIIEFPVPILKGTNEGIKEIREKLYLPEYQDLIVVDFSDCAQSCKTYDEFISKIAKVPENELNYFGIAICGPKKKVNKLTGSIALLR